jgi:hypothetical protein
MNYNHKEIKRFSLSGEIYDDSSIPRLKSQYMLMIIDGMKHEGYVPRYDIDSDFTISYNGKTFDFELSVYGVYVGEKSSSWISGIDKNVPIKTTIQKAK